MAEESALEKRCVKRARKAGWWSAKIMRTERRGRPDRVFARRPNNCELFVAEIIWVEFKRPGEEPTPQQHAEHERMREAGMQVEWVDNDSAFAAILRL